MQQIKLVCPRLEFDRIDLRRGAHLFGRVEREPLVAPIEVENLAGQLSTILPEMTPTLK